MGSNSKQQQPGATSNLQDSAGQQRKNSFGGAIYPFAHFFLGYWLPGIAAVPTDGVEGGLCCCVGLMIGFVVELLPTGKMFRIEFPGNVVFGIAGNVGHESLVAVLVLLGNNYAVSNRRVLLKHCLNLPWLNSETSDLDLLIQPTQKLDLAICKKTSAISCPVQS